MGEQVIIAGFGGQGILVAGQLLAYAGMLEGKEVSWLPSYGAEMRGGTARCTVVISEGRVTSPIVPNPSGAIVMNRPSLDLLEPMVKAGGVLVMNTSLIDRKANRQDLRIFEAPVSELAEQLGSVRAANIVALGVYLGATKVVTPESVIKAMPKVFPRASGEAIALNITALQKGMGLAQEAARAHSTV